MKVGYNLRQQKIYDDYKVYSSEKLEEFLKSDKFTSAINDIIIDILNERDPTIQIDNQDNIENQYQQDTKFFYIPKIRFVILSFISLGLFQNYWIYKNWQFIRDRERPEIKPFWRGFFGIFFCHSLLNYVKNDKELNSNIKANFNSSNLATEWIIFSIIGNLLAKTHDNIYFCIGLIISTLSFLFLCPVQNYINKVYDVSPHEYCKWTLGQSICIIYGIIMGFVVIYSIINFNTFLLNK